MLPALFSLAAVSVAAASISAPQVRHGMRTDGVDVSVPAPGVVKAEFEALRQYPFKPFSAAAVKKALASPTNWTAHGAVTPAKDQGAHGYCGTFGRVAAAEGQYALRAGKGLESFSEQELVSCVGWDRDQFAYFSPKGFLTSADFPYNTTGPDMDPPIPFNPCRYDAKKVINGTNSGAFTDATGAAPSEDQLVAFLHRNGPVQTGIASDVFGLRAKGCEATGDCFITAAMCDKVKGQPIDHSITLVGYGTDPIKGDYWIVKCVCVCGCVCRQRPPAASLTPPPLRGQELVVRSFRKQGLYQRRPRRQLCGHCMLRKRVHVWCGKHLLRLRMMCEHHSM